MVFCSLKRFKRFACIFSSDAKSEPEGDRLAINPCNIIKVLFSCGVFVAGRLECVLTLLPRHVYESHPRSDPLHDGDWEDDHGNTYSKNIDGNHYDQAGKKWNE